MAKLKRRDLAVALGLGVLAPFGRAFAADQAAEAKAFIKRVGDAILAVENDAGSARAQQAAYARIVDQAVDVDGVGRFALGRFWRIATPEQRTQYLQLFREYLVFNVTGRLRQHKGVTFVLGRAEPLNGNISVASTIKIPGSAPAQMDWIVSFASGEPKIVDLLAEGTSLRITQRNDYASVIMQHGGTSIQPLLEAMRGQIARLKSGAS